MALKEEFEKGEWCIGGDLIEVLSSSERKGGVFVSICFYHWFTGLLFYCGVSKRGGCASIG